MPPIKAACPPLAGNFGNVVLAVATRPLHSSSCVTLAIGAHILLFRANGPAALKTSPAVIFFGTSKTITAAALARSNAYLSSTNRNHFRLPSYIDTPTVY